MRQFQFKNDRHLYLGASAILKSVDFRVFAVNVKTIAPTQKLYQSGHAIWCERLLSELNYTLIAYLIGVRFVFKNKMKIKP